VVPSLQWGCIFPSGTKKWQYPFCKARWKVTAYDLLKHSCHFCIKDSLLILLSFLATRCTYRNQLSKFTDEDLLLIVFWFFYDYVSRFSIHISVIVVCCYLLGIIWVWARMFLNKNFLEFVIHFHFFVVLLLGTTWICAAMFLGKEFTQMSSWQTYTMEAQGLQVQNFQAIGSSPPSLLF
jgi:hypothetical protein